MPDGPGKPKSLPSGAAKTYSTEQPPVLWHQSGVNAKGEPFIQLVLGEKIIAQMTVEECRQHALVMLETAEAAETDAFLMDWAKNKLKLDGDRRGLLVAHFREYRQNATGKVSGQKIVPGN